ncbi:MAG: hypothetical protein OIN86_06725 [Candidatus Methanoperedens sp.]|nr:hypothetical protein [Candidatus Methanoperedens sp.]CAG0956175.1 hypothetical protein METP1_00459 [Methanosarcinales archaeon]
MQDETLLYSLLICFNALLYSTELLTKKDIPKERDGLLWQFSIIDTTPKAPVTVPKAEPPKEAAKPADEPKDAAKQADEQPKEPPKPASEGQKESKKPEGDDWKDVFNVVHQSGSKPAAVNQTCTENLKKPKEEWESKFENIKSATATPKGKGG